MQTQGNFLLAVALKRPGCGCKDETALLMGFFSYRFLDLSLSLPLSLSFSPSLSLSVSLFMRRRLQEMNEAINKPARRLNAK